jgi:carbonic anhydrase
MQQGFDRRQALKGLAALACPVCLANSVALAAEGPHWGYEGEGAPSRWGSLSPDFKTCDLGLEQSPIDLATPIHAEAGPVEIAYGPIPLRVVNNGHTIQVNVDPGCGTVIAGTRYELLQFHFHHPSEHLLSGRSFDLECHFVHRSSAGDLAVHGVLMQPGAPNAALQPIWEAMPQADGPEQTIDRMIDPAALLPRSHGYFRYMGSLTTPPCSEGITWTIFHEPVDVSPEQVRQFAALYPANARPVRSRGRRFLLESS